MFPNLNFKKFFIAITLLAIITAGCLSVPSLPVTSTSAPKSTLIPSITTAILPITSSPTSTPVCPAINSDVKLTPPESNHEIADRILVFLNSGGDFNQINSYLAKFKTKALDVLAADLNDDGLDEIVVAGALPLDLKSPGQGVIYILGCRQKSYEIYKQFDFQNIASVDILRTEKLLAEYPQQVIIRYRQFTGWASRIIAIGFMNEDWQVVFDDTDLFPEPVVFDQDNNGNKEISIHSTTTATQGPQRKMISTFKWDGKQYTLISNQLMPGTTRVEYLDDAQGVLDKGDVSMAIAYYDRAAHDSSLNNFASRDEIVNNQTDLAGSYQISFALFRLNTLWSSVGDFDKAYSIIKEMEELFPINMPGYEFLQATKIFEEKIVQGKTPIEACNDVSSFLTKDHPDLNVHIGDWGVSVVEYTQIIELCPFH